MTQGREAYAQDQTPVNAWNLRLGHEICADVQAGLDHEWLVTNGLGGYAAGSILGATTRSYHGLLVAALRPPVVRTVLIAKIDEEVILPDGRTCKLGVNEYQDGTIDPQGYTYLDSFWLEGDIPCFLYRLSDTLSLEKRIWMEYGCNTTYVQYTLKSTLVDTDDHSHEHVVHPVTAVTLKLFPFCLSRDYHSSTQGLDDWRFLVDSQSNRCHIRAFEGALVYQLIADPVVTFTPTGLWYWHVKHRREEERGLLAHEDVYLPGVFSTQIVPGMSKTLVLSAEADMSSEFGGSDHEDAVARALLYHQHRISYILSVAARDRDDLQLHDPVHARLAVAADQFIVACPDATNPSTSSQPLHLSPDRKTIIAGYPWFTDWGRDSMIALPGLLLCTGRYGEARGLLKAFASFVHHGLIPNHFPDGGDAPAYNTVDATLWMFHALDRYFKTTNDWALLKELFPILSGIIQWHIRGTDYNIHVDQTDGLLYAGIPGVQLTWMDAKVDDLVMTPRRGKPVEVNALWYYALTAMESWAVHLSIDATQYSQLRTQVRQHFATRFWYGEGGYLYDVIDVDGVAGQNDASLRPNQLFAASLTHDLLLDMQVDSILQQVTAHLLTPAGLRSLSPADPHYHDHFRGDRRQRDSAYHQGTVWQWLIGPYVDVHLRLYNDRAKLVPLLESLVEQLWSCCLGTISEVAEPEPPFDPGGCFAQAWSVAELLRCWLLVAKPIGEVGGV
ncbi:MAG TPA: amylo-alpha-1,6-glucosidase [Ktedonobacteraceae bacterium]